MRRTVHGGVAMRLSKIATSPWIQMLTMIVTIGDGFLDDKARKATDAWSMDKAVSVSTGSDQDDS